MLSSNRTVDRTNLIRSIAVATTFFALPWVIGLGASAANAEEIAVDPVIDLPTKVDLPGLGDDVPIYWKRIGKGVIAGGDAERDWIEAQQRTATPDLAKQALDEEDREGFTRWQALNLETGEEYVVEMPREMLRRIGEAAEKAGINQSFEGSAESIDETERTQPVAKGWSNGHDSRVRRYNNTSFPYRAMGQIGGGRTSGCSGTLIGSRHVLTAAHCIWNRSNNSWFGFTFRPGREGTCDEASCEPYGSYGAIWYFTPVGYRTAANGQQWKYDYGIVTTTGRPGYQTGWMGYVAVGANTLKDHCNNDLLCKHRGYPACGLTGAPTTYESCKQGWAYQDYKVCKVDNFKNPDGDGWNRRFDVDCDSSGGHSGGPLFSLSWGANNADVVFGVASTHICFTCPEGQRWVNTYRRITPEVLDWISYFKTVKFP